MKMRLQLGLGSDSLGGAHSPSLDPQLVGDMGYCCHSSRTSNCSWPFEARQEGVWILKKYDPSANKGI
jgi:hypothetical protein